MNKPTMLFATIAAVLLAACASNGPNVDVVTGCYGQPDDGSPAAQACWNWRATAGGSDGGDGGDGE